MSKFKLAFTVLLVCLCVSVSFNVYQFLHHSSSRIHLSSFHFSWVNRHNATQTMDVVFEVVPTLVGANLSVTAKIFTDSVWWKEDIYMKYSDAPLILGFDFDGDGQLKEGDFLFHFSDN